MDLDVFLPTMSDTGHICAERLRLANLALEALREQNELIRTAMTALFENDTAARTISVSMDLAAVKARQAWEELHAHLNRHRC